MRVSIKKGTLNQTDCKQGAHIHHLCACVSLWPGCGLLNSNQYNFFIFFSYNNDLLPTELIH